MAMPLAASTSAQKLASGLTGSPVTSSTSVVSQAHPRPGSTGPTRLPRRLAMNPPGQMSDIRKSGWVSGSGRGSNGDPATALVSSVLSNQARPRMMTRPMVMVVSMSSIVRPGRTTSVCISMVPRGI